MKKIIDSVLRLYARLLDWMSAIIERVTGRRTWVHAPCDHGWLSFTANAPYAVSFVTEDDHVVSAEDEEDVLAAFERCAHVLDLSGRHDAAADVREIIEDAKR